MSTDPRLSEHSNARVEAARVSLENMRKRLLDLSNRNRLLNYRHRDSARQIRITNTSLNSIFAALASGSEIRLRGLPDPDGDEVDAEVSAALEKARLLDPEYQEALAAEDEGKQSRIDERIREQVRQSLGLSRSSPTAADIAIARGLKVDYDLPIDSESDEPSTFLQALLFDQALSRKLSAIRDEAQTTLQELGINTLYVALGFLEWYESDASSRTLHSPLVIIPIELNRLTERGRYTYRVKGIEEELETNITLEERLRQDFEITLPTFDPGRESLRSFLESVKTAIEGKQRWRVRSFATIGLFNFTRLSMYRDLDSSRRPPGEALDEHDLILDLLGGIPEERKAWFTPLETIGSPYLNDAPAIIADADASQYSAIMEALAGKTFVIEGPPGTGKSQTITNIIAAAMNSGKTVLFVAEKLAALQVVKSRLDHAGLGEFCLELHSTKTRKTDFYAAIESRLRMSPPTRLPNLVDSRFEANKQSRFIDTYCDALHKVTPAFGCSLFDLIWREQELRLSLGPAVVRLQGLLLPNLERIDQHELRDLKAKISEYMDRLRAFTKAFGDRSSHPLALIQAKTLPRDSVIDLRHRLEAVLGSIALIEEALDAIHLSSDIIDWEVGSLRSFKEFLEKGTQLQSCPDARLVHALYKPSVDVFALHAICERLLESRSLIMTTSVPTNLIGSEVLEQIVARADILGLVSFDSCKRIEEMRAEQQERSRTFRAASSLLTEIIADLRLSCAPTISIAAAIVKCAESLKGVEVDALQLFNPDIRKRTEFIRQSLQYADDLQVRLNNVMADYSIGSKTSIEDLRAHSQALLDTKWSSWFSSDHRRAVRFYRGICRQPGDNIGIQEGRGLEQLACLLEETRRFEGDAEMRKLLGSTFQGLATDKRRVKNAMDSVDRLETILANSGIAGKRLEVAIFSTGTTGPGLLQAVATDSRFPAMKELAQINSPVDDITSQLGEIDGRFQELKTASHLWSGSGIPPEVTLRELREALEASRNGKAATAALERIPDVGSLILADLSIEGLEVALASLAYLAYVRDLTDDEEAISLFLNPDPADVLGSAGNTIIRAWDQFCAVLGVLQETVGFDFEEASKTPLDEQKLEELGPLCEGMLSSLDTLPDWLQFRRLESEMNSLGLQSFNDMCLNESELNVAEAFEYAVIRAVIEDAFGSSEVLSSASGVILNDARSRFRKVDRQYIEDQRIQLRYALAKRPIPSGNGIGKKSTYTDYRLLDWEAKKSSRRHVSIRELMRRASAALQAAKPCFMMSPLSVAQYIKAGTAHFDIVVIDEASQMRPEDALGAISRGSQLVVVGDPKQLPPTTFFDRLDSIGEVPDEDSDDAKSILDLAMQQFGLTRRLIWHYRSRHDSLIAFSNQHFYDNELIVFPSADQGENVGVKLRTVPGRYNASLNAIEAQRIASRAIEIMVTEPQMSLAVVAINQPQRDLIRMELERLVAENPKAQKYIERWDAEVESFIIKNLESIQGDERDVVLISTVYGPKKSGDVHQNFGPINNAASGWRRLNVLLTRAKYRIELFTSLKAADIVVDESTSRGAKALHDYIDFAGTGRLVDGKITGRAPDSDFECAVTRELERHGYECVPQVGVANYFIDIGIIDPRDKSRFIVGIECDGSVYHSSKSARDRDRLRQDVLEGLGWTIHRVWSTDWFADSAREVARLVGFIEDALEGKPLGSKGHSDAGGTPLASATLVADDQGKASEEPALPVPAFELLSQERNEGSLFSSEIVEALLRSLPDTGMAVREEVLDAVAGRLGLPLTKRLRSLINKVIMTEVAARRLMVDASWTRIGRA